MKTNIQNALAAVLEKRDLSYETAVNVMNDIMSGECTDAQIGAWLTAMRMKGETPEEIAAGISVMRSNCVKIKCSDSAAVDIVGTGGDGIGTWNISTAAVFVAAGAGVTVAKHGNRALSSKSGSADVLSSLGINTSCSVETMEKALAEIGVSFLFAPLLHPAMKYAIGPRREMAARTLFNLLGPMTNPAGVSRGLIGVFDKHYCKILAEAAASLGEKHMIFVHGFDGLDELTVTASSYVCEVKNGVLQEYEFNPEEIGLKLWPLADLLGGTPENNAAELKAVLEGKEGAYREAVMLNAAAGIYTSGKAESLQLAIKMAGDSIDSGRALEKLELLKSATNV